MLICPPAVIPGRKGCCRQGVSAVWVPKFAQKHAPVEWLLRVGKPEVRVLWDRTRLPQGLTSLTSKGGH